MNINIPPDSQAWLFGDHGDADGAKWSFRYPPACEVGDTIVFRFDGKAVARAKVYAILPPGTLDGPAHHGKRYLSGHKVVWFWSSFEDMRGTDWDPDVHLWKCQMCGHIYKKKSPGVPNRSCPHCGCRFEDRRFWQPVEQQLATDN
jgi:hypothetical protein